MIHSGGAPAVRDQRCQFSASVGGVAMVHRGMLPQTRRHHDHIKRRPGNWSTPSGPNF